MNIDQTSFINHLKKEKAMMISSIVSIIIILTQIFLTPFVYGFSELQMEVYQNCIIFFSLGFSGLSILQLKIFDFNKKLLDNERIESYLELKDSISYQIFKNNENLKTEFKITDILNCHSQFDLIELQVINPKLFYQQFIECISYNIFCSLSEFVEIRLLEKLKNTISRIDLVILENISRTNNNFKIKEYFKRFSYQFFDSVAQLDFKDSSNVVYDQNQFLNQLSKIENVYKEIRKQNCSYDSNIYLRNYNNFLRFQNLIQFNCKNEILINDKNDLVPQFNKTKFQYISNMIKNNQKQNLNVDKLLGKQQFESLNGKSLLNNYKSNNLSIKYIQNLIENRIGVVHKIIDEQSFNAEIKNKIKNQKIKQAHDKLISTTLNKINRKFLSQKEINCPGFIMIKDQKRLSLNFENQIDICKYLEEIKTIFGQNFELELKFDDFQIRIIQLKNGFKDLNESSNQVDLKLIFEAYHVKNEISFFFEVQLNLDILIKFKQADHLIYDYSRQKDNILSLNYDSDLFIQQNSNYRIFLMFLKFIITIIFIFIIILGIIITQNDYKKNFNEINCRKGNKSCYNYCNSKKELSQECLQYIENQKLSLTKYQQFQLASKQQRYNEESRKISIKLFKDLNYLDVRSQQNFCLFKLKDHIRFCLDNQQDNRYITTTDLKKLKYDGFKQAMLDKNNNFVYFRNIDQKNEQQKKFDDIVKNNSIIDFDFNQYQFCILLESGQIYCSYYEMQVIYIRPDKDNNICYVFSNNISNCLNQDSSFIFEIDDKSRFNALKIFINSFILCTIKTNNMVYCFVQNKQQSDLIVQPEIIGNEEIKLLKMGGRHVCGIFASDQFICWGAKNYFGETDIPSNFGVLYFDIGDSVTCIININHQMKCIGAIQFDFDNLLNNDIKILSVADKGANLIINQQNKDVYLFLFNYQQYLISLDLLEVQTENDFQCYYSNQDLNTEDSGFRCSIRIDSEFNDIDGINQNIGSNRKIRNFNISSPAICLITEENEGKCLGYKYYNIEKTEQNELTIKECTFIELIGAVIQFICKEKVGISYNDKLKRLLNVDQSIPFIGMAHSWSTVLITKTKIIFYITEYNTIEIIFDKEINDFGFGEFQVCISFINQNINCYDYDSNIIKLDDSIKDNVYKVGFNDNGFCVMNFQIEFLCQYFYNEFIIQQKQNYDINELID